MLERNTRLLNIYLFGEILQSNNSSCENHWCYVFKHDVMKLHHLLNQTILLVLAHVKYRKYRDLRSIYHCLLQYTCAYYLRTFNNA